jgi:N6-L-threonylcarbamoyladenine synthase
VIYVKTFAIESTCDDTSIAIVSYDDGVFVVDEMITHTQGMHQQYGGVVPEFASRAHAESFVDVLKEMIGIETASPLPSWSRPREGEKSRILSLEILKDIDCITVASQPWLPGSITMWVTAAYTLGEFLDIPVIEVNHIMGHVWSILLDRSLDILKMPYLCLTVSGGHSDVYMVQEAKTQKVEGSKRDDWHKRGHMGIWESTVVGKFQVTKRIQTMDDAVGEAFDKVAKMLGGPYPGGRRIGERAIHRESKWETRVIEDIVIQRLRKIAVSEQFSFSGIKAQVHSLLDYLKRMEQTPAQKFPSPFTGDTIPVFNEDGTLREDIIALICWRFQEVVTDALVSKLEKEQQLCPAKTIWVVGGVSANTRLMEKVTTLWTSFGIDIYTPAQLRYTSDNAAMIGVVGLLERISCLNYWDAP